MHKTKKILSPQKKRILFIRILLKDKKDKLIEKASLLYEETRLSQKEN